MKDLTIIVTGAGAPGILGTIYSLKNNWDQRPIRIIGTDIDSDVVGAYVCDEFRQIPRALDKENYLSSLVEICKTTNADIILPQNTMELEILSNNISMFQKMGVEVIISGSDSLRFANNKYLLMQHCENIGVPVGSFKRVNNFIELKLAASELGWPNKSVVVKPPVSNGQRGVRIISENYDQKIAFYEDKPSDLYTNMDSLYRVLGDTFPELIITEYLPGIEYTVDVLNVKGKQVVIPRKRDKIRSGITFVGSVEKHAGIIKSTEMLINSLEMKYCFGFQFKLDAFGIPKILESNPRVQGTMVLATIAGANVIYGAVKSALGESIPEFDIDWNARLHRYWGGVGVSKDITYL